MVKNKNNMAIWGSRIKKDASTLFQKVGNSIDIDKKPVSYTHLRAHET